MFLNLRDYFTVFFKKNCAQTNGMYFSSFINKFNEIKLNMTAHLTLNINAQANGMCFSSFNNKFNEIKFNIIAFFKNQ